MDRPRLLLVLLLLLSLTLAAGAIIIKKFSQPQPETNIIRLMEGPRSVYHLPHYIALALGFFKEQGLEVVVENTDNNQTLLPALAGERADVALVGLEQAIYSRADGSLGDVVAFAAVTRRDSHFLLARKANDPFEWASLKEKTVIAGWPESIETVLLEGLLRQKNIAPYREVTLYTNIPASLRIGAFSAGSGDFIILAEPQASMVENAGLGRVVVSLGKEAGPFPAAVYAARAEFIRSNPVALQRFTNAVYKAQLWLAHHSTRETARVVRPYFKDMEENILVQAIERYRAQETWPANPVIDPGRYNYLMDLLDQAREIARRIPPEHMLNNQFAQKAVETVKYVPEKGKPRWFERLKI
ncbi:ABC transporter substrate-binding protein [Desulfofundulus thermosubterraneus]|uniref:NitT/TauT family transport system substrate-binding protein n=1 Tax=Desulfofundulus thermosubterraneus DSM 16057 TaxID=1121432 RepID=A0A1M6FKU5_9FIRM|nr:ABC transporter substrate-binding protein [Desulfofundulus thermosubterraneus]SHI98269.1 NitT/TauT family transport system substrate-binding protein [Desulfofundulus thermosubterraneus DSM 16057]